MITLVIRPNFNFKLKENEAGDYYVILPQDNTILWKMWCSSLTWLSTDLTYDFDKTLANLFGEDKNIVFKLDLKREMDLETINKGNEQIDLNDYYRRRVNYKIPYWAKEDPYQTIWGELK